MRHFLLPGAVPGHPFGMLAASPKGSLVTPTGITLLDPARFPGTATGAINLASVAPTADNRLTVTAHATKETWRYRRRRISRRDKTWTRRPRNGRMPLHSCPARCRARCRDITCQYWPAPRLVLNPPRLLLRQSSRHTPAKGQKNGRRRVWPASGRGSAPPAVRPYPAQPYQQSKISLEPVRANSFADTTRSCEGQFNRIARLSRPTDTTW